MSDNYYCASCLGGFCRNLGGKALSSKLTVYFAHQNIANKEMDVAANLKSIYRTHTCAGLRREHVGMEIRLSGWIHRKRNHGGVLFIDLRDNYGISQVVFKESMVDMVDKIRVESVIQIQGKVLLRTDETINPNLETGEVEVHCESYEILGASQVLPFQISEEDKTPEPTRLEYRFLELRRETLHHNILLRSKIIKEIRKYMDEVGFTEFQTPILTSSSPEGARDFLVPSRLHPGKFFALPQAPQQFKQLLMVAGFDRYFQIAPCFRDEDARADRSPGEFYQVDLEMSFVEQEEVFEVGEGMFHHVFTTFSDAAVTPLPFPRITYRDALLRYGTDKPDLRNPLEISEVSNVFASTQFKVFSEVIANKGRVFAIHLALDSLPPRKFFDDTIAEFKTMSGSGLGYVNFDHGETKGTIAKFMSEDEIDAMKSQLGITNDKVFVVFFGAGRDDFILPHLGKLRNKLGAHFDLIEKTAYRFCWIVDFPMYEYNEDAKKIDFSHNPFSMPAGGLDALLNKDPLDIVAYQYDVVCNGYEVASGAVRNHKPEIMYKAFEIAGYPKEVVDQKFAGMIKAFSYGAPPHAGMAPGVDRIVMLLAGNTNFIRDVIAFPLAQNAEDLMMKAPSEVSDKQLKDLHIRVVLPENQDNTRGAK